MISVIPATVVKEGETVTMQCTSSGNPVPSISWKKKASSGEAEKIFKEATLTIQNINIQDMGLYECEAYNQFGKEDKAVKLLVQGMQNNREHIFWFIYFRSRFHCVMCGLIVAVLSFELKHDLKVNESFRNH